jgi:RNA polymerase sigma-70 factor (ECF subfamily)
MIRETASTHHMDVEAQELAIPAPLPASISGQPSTSKPSRDTRITGVVRAHHDFIWRLLRRLGVPDANVDDATQEVFCIAARRIDEIADGSERSFLFGTAVRIASDSRRSARHREQPDGELDQQVSPDASPEELADVRRKRQLLDEILACMPIELRTVLVLFELEQMTKSEIAALLEIPEGTVMSRVRRAREEFKARAKRRLARDVFKKVEAR